MTNNTNKALSKAIQAQFEAQADRVQKACTACFGGKRRDTSVIITCPTCTQERQRLLKRAEAFVWIDMDDQDRMLAKGITPLPVSDPFTVESITAILKELGLWEAFVDWNDQQLAEVYWATERLLPPDEATGDWVGKLVRLVRAMILQNVKLYAQAVTSFLNGRITK